MFTASIRHGNPADQTMDEGACLPDAPPSRRSWASIRSRNLASEAYPPPRVAKPLRGRATAVCKLSGAEASYQLKTSAFG
jgi:hypothetical protein